MTNLRESLLKKRSELSTRISECGTKAELVLVARDLSRAEASEVVIMMLVTGMESAHIQRSASKSGTFTVSANLAITTYRDIPLDIGLGLFDVSGVTGWRLGSGEQ